MRLTTEERKVFKSMLDYAPGWDLLTIMWWGFVNQEKQRILMGWLMVGMRWRYAMMNAKKNITPPKSGKPSP